MNNCVVVLRRLPAQDLISPLDPWRMLRALREQLNEQALDLGEHQFDVLQAPLNLGGVFHTFYRGPIRRRRP